MNTRINTKSKKRKLLFDYYSASAPGERALQNVVSERKIIRLKKNKVKTVFIISSEAVCRDAYLQLVTPYQDYGFIVKSIHIDKLDSDHLQYVKNIIEEIYSCFKKGSCQVVSFGKSFTGTIISCLFVLIGVSVEDAIARIKNIKSDLIGSEKELSYIYEFQGYLRSLKHADLSQYSLEIEDTELTKKGSGAEDTVGAIPGHQISDTKSLKLDTGEAEIKAGKKTISPSAEVVDPHKKETRKPAITGNKSGEKEKAGKMPARIDAIESGGFGRFYSSIRFKLISIISFIIVISLSGMIFLATHYFRSDNEIRVNENNLKISGVVSLKVKSDFQTIIDKSKLIANVMMQNISSEEIKRNSELILHNDKDFIFFGLAAPEKRGTSFRFIKTTYNTPLMNDSQITKVIIESAHRASRKVFARSLDGEIVVHNVSLGFKLPVIGISLPFHKNEQGRVKSLLVCYIKLDRFLNAFQTTGITKAFMVNDVGDIIAHPDSAIVVSGGNYINLPIVKMMMKSTLGNGQTRYKDEEGIIHLGSFKKIGIGSCGVIATVEEDIAFREIYNMQRRNLYLMIIVLTVVILIVYFFGKTLTTPIIRLVSATKKIKEGQYHVDIRPAAKDEIGELTNSFIEMGIGLEEREKMKDAFGKFVNKEIADQILKGEIHLGGERKKAAVFFSDIRSFTAISEKLEPEEVVEFLNDYMTRMVKCVHDTNGVVDKYIGDAIMAEWGVPISKGNDTENAINAALLMRESLIEFNIGRGDPKKPLIRIGSGINTGPVLAGQIGSEDRMEYTVIGDAVNLASRIEALNKPFGTDLLISQDSYNEVQDIFAVEKMSPIKVKGKDEPQQIYAVLGRVGDPKCPKSVEELRKYLGIEEKPFHRRFDDPIDDEEEVKYEILE